MSRACSLCRDESQDLLRFNRSRIEDEKLRNRINRNRSQKRSIPRHNFGGLMETEHLFLELQTLILFVLFCFVFYSIRY